MNGKLTELVAEIDARLDVLQGDLSEINEMYEEEFNPMDWSGGNFDDAYDMGEEHGRVFEEVEQLNKFKTKLKAVLGGR